MVCEEFFFGEHRKVLILSFLLDLKLDFSKMENLEIAVKTFRFEIKKDVLNLMNPS